MKMKYVYLPLFTALVINHANGLDSTEDPTGPVPKGTDKRSALTSSAMTHEIEEFTENVQGSNHSPVTVPPLKASAPIDVPVPKKGSPKGIAAQGQSPSPKGVGSPKGRVRYVHGSMAADVVTPNPGKPSEK